MTRYDFPYELIKIGSLHQMLICHLDILFVQNNETLLYQFILNSTIKYYIKRFVTSMLISKHLYKEQNPSIMIIVNRMDTYLRDIISFSTYNIFSMSGKRDTFVGVFYEFTL